MPFKPPVRLNQHLARQLLADVDNFLFDCDGVIWNWPSIIPGSIELINKLKKLNKNCFFITNNSTKTRDTLVTTSFVNPDRFNLLIIYIIVMWRCSKRSG